MKMNNWKEKLGLKTGVGLLILILLSFFVYNRSSAFLAGPEIVIDTPTNGQSVTGEFIEISGQAKRISRIFLNDGQIFTDDQGYFKEQLLLPAGYNILTLTAKDRFNRTIKKEIELFNQS